MKRPCHPNPPNRSDSDRFRRALGSGRFQAFCQRHAANTFARYGKDCVTDSCADQRRGRFTRATWLLAALDQSDLDDRRVDSEKSRIVLKHERIKSIDMEGMTMQFDVARSISLAGFNPGDAVRFQIVNRQSSLEVVALEKR